MKRKMGNRSSNRLLVQTLLCGSILAANTAYSQSESAGNNILEEIIVTAQRKNQSLQDVPIAMTAVTPEYAEKFGLSNMRDVQLVTPGTDFAEGSGFLQMYIRGIGQAYASPGLEAPVAIYLDGGYLQRTAGYNSLLDLVDIDRVEILRGPQGTLYGRNATGGAVLLYTAKPTQEFGGRLAAQYGRFNHTKVDGMLNIPMTDTLSARFAARTEKRDGYIKNTAGDRESYHDEDNYTVRGKLRWQPNDMADAVLTTEYQKSTPRKGVQQNAFDAPICYTCQSTGDAAVSDFYETNQNKMPAWDVDVFRTSLNVTFDFESYQLTSNTSYLDDEAVQFNEADYTPSPVFVFENRGVGGETLTQEFILSSQYGGPLNFTTGVNYLKDNADFVIALTGSRYAAFPAEPSVANVVETESTSAFVEAIYDVTDSVTMTLGGRYSKDERSLDGANNAGFQAFGLPAEFSDGGSFYAFTPRFVLNWSGDSTNIYYSYTEGFKAGGIGTPATAPAARAVESEEIKSHEIGVKHKAFDNKLSTNFAIFYYEDTNLHTQIQDAAGGGSFIQNAGGVDGRGAELEMTAFPTASLTMGMALAYLDTEYSKYDNASVNCLDLSGTADPFNPGAVLYACNRDLSGETTPHAPEFTAAIFGDYNFKIADWDASVSGLVRYSSSYDFYPDAGGDLGFDKQDAYTIVNLSGYVSPPASSVQLGFYVDNALDKEYLITASTNSPDGAGYVAASPRTYGLRVVYSF